MIVELAVYSPAANAAVQEAADQARTESDPRKLARAIGFQLVPVEIARRSQEARAVMAHVAERFRAAAVKLRETNDLLSPGAGERRLALLGSRERDELVEIQGRLRELSELFERRALPRSRHRPKRNDLFEHATRLIAENFAARIGAPGDDEGAFFAWAEEVFRYLPEVAPFVAIPRTAGARREAMRAARSTEKSRN